MTGTDLFEQKIAAARKAQRIWAAMSYSERRSSLQKAQKFLASHVEEIAEAIRRDMGKLVFDALSAELLPALMGISYYLKHGKQFCKSKKIRGANILMFNKVSRLIYEPFGVIGIISPWNYPFAIPFSEVLMALLAGNAVILKVASSTPETGRALDEIFAAAALPDGLFSSVQMRGEDAGRAFTAPGGVDKLFFTGSTKAGKELAILAAQRLLPVVLELGGADAAIIRADADLDRAVSGIIWAGFANTGQSCGGVQRIFADRRVYDAFLEKLCQRVRNLRAGDGPDVDLGPMANARQKQRFEAQIAACVAAGDRIAAQSSLPPPQDENSLFVPATVLSDIQPASPVLYDEIFGPVVAVIPVENDEEAVSLANNSQYALTGSVWSRSARRAADIAARINAGAIMINDHLMSHGLAETPWGGFGDSGLGRTHGELGFREMLRTKVIVKDTLPAVKRDLWWQPYSRSVHSGLLAIIQLLAGGSVFCRIAAIPRVVKVFLRTWK